VSLPQAKRIRQTETAVPTSNTSKDPSASGRPGLHKGGENAEEDESDGEESTYEENNLPSTEHHLSGLAGLRNAMAEAACTRKEFNRPQKRRKRELEPAMDYLINAENRVGIGCRRKVFDVCFENDAAGEKVLSFECRYRYSATRLDTDHLQCNEDQPMGCERCHVGSPAVCCDIHNPSEFSSFASVVAK